MSSDQFRFKRPFSPDASTLEQLKEWPSPDLSNDMRKYEKTNALNKLRPDPKVPAEPDDLAEEDVSIKPLTAEQMEELRQQAYEAGFSEGKDDGFAKGYEEGRQQGQEDGVKQGLAEGKKLGLEQGQQQSEQQFKALEQLLDQLQRPLKQLEQQVEQELLALTLAMAKAVVQTEVATNQAVILKALQQAIDALPLRHGKVHIKLHPDDLAIIQQHYNAEALSERGWQLLAEPALSRGGCQLATEQSHVDRTLEQRLATALAHFMHQDSVQDDIHQDNTAQNDTAQNDTDQNDTDQNDTEEPPA